MSYAIVQYEDRDTSEYAPLMRQARAYCEAHGITYLFVGSGYSQYPPWWRKVFLVQELLPSFDAVLWLDTDATIVSHDHFSTLFDDKHFAFSPNPPMLDSESLSMFSAPFCAGVWAVRNTPEGNAIMKHWAACFNRAHWTRSSDGKWVGSGPYAGYAYEQGAFEIGVVRVAEFAPWLRPLHHNALNYLPRADGVQRGLSCPAGVFAVHYWKGHRQRIRDHWPSGPDV